MGWIYATIGPRGDCVLVFGETGTFLGSWGTSGRGNGQFVLPCIVALDGHGNAYVSDGESDSVQKFRLLPPLAPEATPKT